jgi:hypothetical protein
MDSGEKKFKIDFKKLSEGVDLIHRAATEGKGVFEGGSEVWRPKYLPQWNVPSDDPLWMRRFLYAEDFIEKRGVSRFYAKMIRSVWENPKTRWFFDPYEVAGAKTADIEYIIKDEIHNNLRKQGELSPAERYKINAQTLVAKYSGDPGNAVNGLTVEKAMANLMEFENFGPGLAALLIVYYLDRELVRVENPEDALLKVDTHKSRIPINIGAVKPLNGTTHIHPTTLVEPLTRAYQRICRERKYSPIMMNDCLWVVGSEVCAKRSFEACMRYCPLASAGICKKNVPLAHPDKEKGGYFHTNKETRRGMEQGYFDKLHRQMF